MISRPVSCHCNPQTNRKLGISHVKVVQIAWGDYIYVIHYLVFTWFIITVNYAQVDMFYCILQTTRKLDTMHGWAHILITPTYNTNLSVYRSPWVSGDRVDMRERLIQPTLWMIVSSKTHLIALLVCVSNSIITSPVTQMCMWFMIRLAFRFKKVRQ